MNTEILTTLKFIQNAREEVIDEKSNPDLTEAEQRKLDPLIIHLNNIERALINETRDAMIDALTSDALPLKQLTQEIKASVVKLQRVAGIVQSAAEKVEALIKIMGIAAKVGLI